MNATKPTIAGSIGDKSAKSDMVLLLNHDDVRSVLTPEMTVDALRESYLQLFNGEAVCRPNMVDDGGRLGDKWLFRTRVPASQETTWHRTEYAHALNGAVVQERHELGGQAPDLSRTACECGLAMGLTDGGSFCEKRRLLALTLTRVQQFSLLTT